MGAAPERVDSGRTAGVFSGVEDINIFLDGMEPGRRPGADLSNEEAIQGWSAASGGLKQETTSQSVKYQQPKAAFPTLLKISLSDRNG